MFSGCWGTFRVKLRRTFLFHPLPKDFSFPRAWENLKNGFYPPFETLHFKNPSTGAPVLLWMETVGLHTAYVKTCMLTSQPIKHGRVIYGASGGGDSGACRMHLSLPVAKPPATCKISDAPRLSYTTAQKIEGDSASCI